MSTQTSTTYTASATTLTSLPGADAGISVERHDLDAEGSVTGVQTVNDADMEWEEFNADLADEVLDQMGYERLGQWAEHDGQWSTAVKASR